MSEILPCPWCSTNKTRVVSISKKWVSCDTCFASGPARPTESEAAEAWNEVAHFCAVGRDYDEHWKKYEATQEFSDDEVSNE